MNGVLNLLTRRLYSEISSVFLSAVFILIFFFTHYHSVTEIFLQISVIERISLVFLFSFVLGKIAFGFGDALVDIFFFLFFQEDRKNYFKLLIKRIQGLLKLGLKSIDDKQGYISMPSILNYISSNEEVQNRFINHQSTKSFWSTFLSLLILSIFVYFEYWLFVSLFALCVLLIVVRIKYRDMKFFNDCALETKKLKESS